MSIMQIENLDLFYGDFQALKNVNMEIQANEITAFKMCIRDRSILKCCSALRAAWECFYME